jgi:hypothetical protein
MASSLIPVANLFVLVTAVDHALAFVQNTGSIFDDEVVIEGGGGVVMRNPWKRQEWTALDSV